MTSRIELRSAVAALLLSSAALAEDASSEAARPARFYAGVGAASLAYSGEHRGVVLEDSSIAFGVYGGFKLRERLSIEASYGRADAVDLDDVWGSGVERFDITSNWNTFRVSAVAEVSLQDWFRWRRDWRLYGALGAYKSRIERKVTLRGPATSELVRDYEAGLSLATGVLYEIGVVDLRGYVEWFGVLDDREASDVGVAVQVRF